MTIDLSTLNENQRRAVEWQEGPLLVLAGPGSGKTRVLTNRVARLIQNSSDLRFKVLGLTFTNKAAGEMRERIEKLVPDASARVLLTTFHSFCADLLRQHGHHISLRPDFTILSQQTDREAVLEEALQALKIDHDYNADRLLPLVTRLLDRNIDPAEAAQALQDGGVNDAERLAEVYREYRKQLLRGNRLDFGSLIAESIRLLEEKPAICKQIRRIYPYVCVDEFQDTNESQYRILTHVVNPETRNLIVVADDDQIIYQWNGASPERLEALRTYFDMEVVQLPENYRCPSDVIDIANKLIGNNLARSVDKELLRANKPVSAKPSIRVERFDSLDDEAEWVAKDIASRTPGERARCAVLARTRKVLDVIVRALNKANVNGYLSVRKDEFVTAQFRWLHAMLRLANARQDSEQLRRVCKAFYTLEGISLDARDVVSAAAAQEGDYLRAWAAAALSRAEMEQHTRQFVTNAVPLLSDHLAFKKFTEAAFGWFDQIERTGSDNESSDVDYRDERTVWVQLTNDITSQFGADNLSLHLLLQELDLRSKAPEPPKGAIPCFTIHASKGMEFGHVYLVALVEDQLPSWAAKKKGDDSREMQEERRNCFVAVTRAQDSLTLTYSQEVFGWSKDPSRFLQEMELIEE